MKNRGGHLLASFGMMVASGLFAQQTPSPTPAAGAVVTPVPSSPSIPATPAPSPAEAGETAEPAPTSSPPAAARTPTPRGRDDAPPLRVTGTPNVPVALVPSENPFGAQVDAPAALPAKPPFAEAVLQGALFIEARVDASGKPTVVRRPRDPIPSLSAEMQKDLARWTFEPARRGGQKVEAWAPLRLDLQVEMDPPRLEQASLVPVTPATALPTPFEWGTDEGWYQGLDAAPSTTPDGAVPLAQLEAPAAPKRTPFPDSFRGPFTCRLWVRVAASGRIDRVLPIAASDPILVSYFRKTVTGWTARPARKGTAAVDSWNELTLAGQISYAIEIRQIAQLRKPLPGS